MNTKSVQKTLGKKLFFIFLLYISACSIFLLTGCSDTKAGKIGSAEFKTPEEWGKYLVKIGGCNDCHTPGYMEVDGNLPESEWLVGLPVGFRGPWGTTYPANLRLTVQRMSEDAFVNMAKTRNTLPPMPWPSLKNMNEEDIRAIYKYIKSLGPKGIEAPVYVSADKEPSTPYIDFFPKHMERLAAK